MAIKTDFPTFFTVLARWPREVRLMTVEWEQIENEKEALECLKQNERAILVFRCDADCARRDISEDIAWSWLRELIAGGFNPEEDDMPTFIAEHISISDAIQHFSRDYIPEAAE